MPKKRPPHLYQERTRHGALIWYVRRGKGARTRLRAVYDTPEFWGEYRAALEAAPEPRGAAPQSIEWAIDRYRASSAWAGLSVATRRQRENIYRAVVKVSGKEPLAKLTQAAIIAGRERRAATPHSANNFIKAMRGFCAWAAGDGKLMDADPTDGVKLLRGENDDIGFHTWTEAEVEHFEAHWPLGTRERLAFDLLLYTGLRRGDVTRIGRQHERDGFLSMRTEKTGEVVTVPILPPLAASIAATKTGDLTYLVSERGTPFVKESFGNWFREVCSRAGCPGSAHGLRKAGATRAAEGGATDRELMALYGWTSAKMAGHYTKAADRKRLSKSAARYLMPRTEGGENSPHQPHEIPAPSKKT